MADDTLEQVQLVLRQCFVYRLPPRPSTKGYRAADWGLDKPMWTGRVKVTTKGKLCTITLQDNATGKLFAEAPIRGDEVAKVVEPVVDSSRYFVVRVENQGRHAFLGMGFQERSEAFDFNVALQDFVKSLRKEKESTEPYVSKNDFSLKDGQTMKIAIKTKKNKDAEEDDDDTHATATAAKKAAPMVSLGSIATALEGTTAHAAPSPFAAAPPTTSSSSPAPSSSSSSTTSQSKNPFAATTTAATTESEDPWGAFQSSSSSSTGKSSDDWVAF
ncbi:hypothetical protein PTSG_06947 [Salpingoeca rosetta]|uniref:NECAP PHear domain-containing protein n=1 Tax=Salpingoeca rosetta (strain ATCC 50818 / BSB-021) TaxID=946362 RepID=F2UF95_SALR5|nr:uncharacterized protein PTSG_06947 [Salpingoeca rosetta]EGD75295.1 hypothetical protein PTSG_06947 [Salpingoeca rosetta]|eukprot:XP_004992348.1 hypothetical protein PTSG_06947 [Salpingoeca rosetta]